MLHRFQNCQNLKSVLEIDEDVCPVSKLWPNDSGKTYNGHITNKYRKSYTYP